MEPINLSLPGGPARVLANSKVWLESNALEQLKAVAALPGCLSAVGMPDLHAGQGIPVGAVAAFRDTILPALVGSDAGCGARLTLVSSKSMSLDKLERRLLRAFESGESCDFDRPSVLRLAWRRGPRALSGLAELPPCLRQLAALEPELPELPEMPERYARFATDLGTIGGGNHFLEVTRVTQVVYAEYDPLRDAWGALVHSGSRGLGHALATHWGRAAIPAESALAYLTELAGAVRFAQLNRLLLCHCALQALDALKPDQRRLSVDITHNTVEQEEHAGGSAWIHRKGAAPAHAGQLTLVLGSREAPSWLMQGAGADASLCSVAHGAGRRMSRSQAVAKLRPECDRAALTRTPHGGRVLCADPALLLEEHPSAYKRMDPNIETLEAVGAARRLLALTPQLTLKV